MVSWVEEISKGSGDTGVCGYSFLLIFIHPRKYLSRLDFLTVELDEVNQKCVHSRLLILGGHAGPNGNMCGIRYQLFVAKV